LAALKEMLSSNLAQSNITGFSNDSSSSLMFCGKMKHRPSKYYIKGVSLTRFNSAKKCSLNVSVGFF